MKREELEEWAIRHSFTKDKFGHYQKTSLHNEHIRLKLGKTSVRYERKIRVTDHNEWQRIVSGYYKNLSLTENDRLSGLK